MYKSKCCNADVKYAIYPDFIGDDPKKMRIGTCSFECEKCGKPCDANIDLTSMKNGVIPTIPTDWSLKITRVDNGYTLTGNNNEALPWVIEDDVKDELKSHESLLWETMNYFNFGGSKHDKVRLQVRRIKQKG